MTLTMRTTLAAAMLRSSFRETLDLKAHNLARIVESYVERDKVLCGLSSCRTRHNKGYIVETSASLQTNIGHLCGRLHLGADFKKLENIFRARQRDADSFEAIERFLAISPQLLARVEAIWSSERGGWWLEQCQKRLDALPARVKSRLRDHVRSGNGKIVRTQLSIDEDDDTGFLSHLGYKNQQGVSKIIGELAGLNAASPLNLVKLKGEVLDRIRKYVAASPENMKRGERRAWVTFIDSFEEQSRRLERIVNEGRQFFSRANLAQLLKLTDAADERRAVQRILDAVHNLPIGPNASSNIRAG